MDSQENKKAIDTQHEELLKNSSIAEEQSDKVIYKTKEEVIQKLKQLLTDADDTNKSELDILKQVFYKLLQQETLKKKEDFIQAGGIEEEFKQEADPLEAELHSLISQVKAKRREIIKQKELLKEENLKKKYEIIEKLKAMVESAEIADNSYNEFKNLQALWNETRLIPGSKVKEVWSTYQHYVEQFYDMLRLNHEFREYDFKKNLEAKTELCELAEELDKEDDVVSAFHQLQKFHQQWREIGPVDKSIREEIWERFSNASTVINKKHQAHFEKLKAQEEDNLKAKTALCEQVEAIQIEELNSHKEWKDETDKVLKIQDAWKKIGFVPRKVNNTIFTRFRSSCDQFFKAKSEFYQERNEKFDENLKLKEALCEKAEKLQDSTDWKNTSNQLIQLQKDWKTIGPVPRNCSKAIWERFKSACDTFFNNRAQQNIKKKEAEAENLKAKQEIIDKLNQLTQDEEQAEENNEQIHELIKEWNSIGFVPFKVKDQVYQAYRALIDKHFARVNQGQTKKNIKNFKTVVSNIQEEGNANSLLKERDKLNWKIDRIKSDLKTYENNLGFLTLSSNKGNQLLDGVKRKVDSYKAEISVLEKKISVIDDALDEI